MNKQNELTLAALHGINKFLYTTRGAHLLGAEAKAKIKGKEIVITDTNGDTYYFPGVVVY